MWQRCSACAGEYSSEQLDGTSYFHACPPVVRYRVTNRDHTPDDVDADGIGDRPVVMEITSKRPNHRDENPDNTRVPPLPPPPAPVAPATQARP